MPSHHDNLAAVRAACVAANPEIVAPQPEGYWLLETEIIHAVKATLSDTYQKRFNKSLDYDQWAGIQDHLAQCGRLIKEKIYRDLSLNREAIGREITLPDVLLALGKVPGCIWGVSEVGELWRRPSYATIEPTGVVWNLQMGLSGQTEETVAYLAALLKRDE